MKRILLVAYHFPPLSGSSGIQRALRLVQHLPRRGWEPIVLVPSIRAYETTSDDLLAEIPANTVVRRAFALDSARHLAVGGKYPRILARPDRWMSWRFDGIRQGLQLAKELRPRLVWSTYPIATAHVIGEAIARRASLPWVADFRDPMAQDGYPVDPDVWRDFQRIEETALRNAALCTYTTAGAAQTYRQRYPDARSRIEVLENGYDEEAFTRAERNHPMGSRLNPGAVTLLHSGIVYPEERDPTALFEAIGGLIAADPSIQGRLRLRFRAPVHTDLLARLAASHGMQDVVEILPTIPYADALTEMLRADALLLLQAGNCNEQIPAKLYEYLRARRPIIALASGESDTARLLARFGLDEPAPLDDPQAIASLVRRFFDDPGAWPLPDRGLVGAASRFERSRQFAGWLDEILASTPAR